MASSSDISLIVSRPSNELRLAEMGLEGGHRSFLHKATNGRWKGEVDEADLARYRAKVEAALSPALIAWLEGGRAIAGDPRVSPD